MSDHRSPDSYERAAAGLDFDDPIRDRAAGLGSSIASEGPEAFLNELDELIPDVWKKQIRAYPLTAVAFGVGIGIFLGMKKRDEIIAAGSSMLAAAATANLNDVFGSR